MAALEDFIKKNVKASVGENLKDAKFGKAFIAFDIANLVAGENKLRSIGRLLRDLLLITPVIGAGFAGLFLAMGKSIRSLVHDTGSLEAALKKLSQIQGLQRMFAPLLGGIAAAKMKVAELVNFASSRKISLGDAADASRSLLLMTNGLFSNAQALDLVTDTAKGTNNSIVAVADTVGQFSNQLRNGESISGTTEQLRQMGIVSDSTADQLTQLQKNGASASQIFGALTASMAQFHGSAEAAAGDIDNVNAAYEAAAADLQEKFASPFVESDIENTKNMTDAMNGVAPVVARVSSVFAILFNAFSTTKSWMAKTAGESKVVQVALEGIVYALTALITVASAIGAITLGAWLIGSAAAASGAAAALIAFTGATGAAAAGITALGVAARVAMVVSGIGIFVALLATAAGVMMQLSASAERNAKELNDLAQAHNEVNAAIAKQIASVRTLSDRHEALAKSMDAVTAAQNELTDAMRKGDKARIAESEANLAIAQKNARRVKQISASSLTPTPERLQADRDRVAREIEQKEQRFQDRMAIAKPEEQARLLGQHATEAAAKAKKGAVGEQTRIRFADKSDEASLRVLDRQKAVDVAAARAGTARAAADQAASARPSTRNLLAKHEAISAAQKADEELTVAKQALKNALAHQADVGANAPRGTSVQLESAQRAMLLSNDPDKARKAAEIGLQAERARHVEATRGENELTAMRDIANKKAIERETKLNKMSIDRELAIQEAQLKSDSRTRQTLEDQNTFAEKYQDLLSKGLSTDEAAKTAGKLTANEIALDTNRAGTAGQVADSLQRIGGGGGVGGPAGDPLLSAAQRQLAVQESSRDYLQKIAEANRGVL